jgi:ABC-type transport system involved in multi-copper enzyme maturation permease subunit
VIWIAWRFQRSVACVLALFALIVIGVSIFTGVIEHHDLVQFMGPPCHGAIRQLRLRLCSAEDAKLLGINAYTAFIRGVGFIIAPLVGAILGLLALANEIDNRTVRLAWTQSISRRRWFATKAGVGASIVVIILVPTAIVLSWWSGNIDQPDRFSPQTFGVAGWDLVAYGLFMFALTMLVGAVIRRVGWTLAVSVLLFSVVALAVPKLVRVHLAPTSVLWTSPAVVYQNSTFPQNAWFLLNGAAPRSTVGTPTQTIVDDTLTKIYACMKGYPTKTSKEYEKAEVACYKKFDAENVSVYISDDQFWTLQLREGLLYLGGGILLTGGALSIVRRIEP